MKCLLLFALLLSVLINVTIAGADSTWVSGTIAGQTWTVANSPYCVGGSINVAYLIIQPGVRVVFFGNYDFRVTGALVAVGTREDSIIFTKAASNVPRWAGIWLDHTPAGTEIAYCRIDSANHGLTSDNATNPVVRNTTIRDNYIIAQTVTSATGGGINVSGSLTLSQCRIEGNTAHANFLMGNISVLGGGIHVFANGNLTLNNCIVKNNHSLAQPSTAGFNASACGGGISFLSNGQLVLNHTMVDSNHVTVLAGNTRYTQGGGIYQSGGTATLTNSIVSNNYASGGSNEGGGIYKLASPSALYLHNTTVAYNSNDGIKNTAGNLGIENSIVYLNLPVQISGSATVMYSDIQGGWTGTGNINVYPEFFSPDSLHIEYDSPCVDMGDPIVYSNDPPNPLDPETAVWPAWGGVRNDMGAHGGPFAVGWWQGADIAVSPATLEFDSCRVGESMELTLTISNPGTVNLILLDLETTNACFTTDFNPTFNLLTPGGSAPLHVTFTPDIATTFQDSLVISSSIDTIYVPISGQGYLLPSLSIISSPINPPIQIPRSGGSFQYNLNVHNNTLTPQTFSVWNKVRDTANTYTMVFGPITRTLPGNANPTRTLTQTIAGNISSGMLYFISYVGTYPNSILDSSYFTITKLAVTDDSPWIAESNSYGDLFYDYANDQETVIPHNSSLVLETSPNPFNPSTELRYELVEATQVRLTIWDTIGRLVGTLINERQDIGSHSISFDGSGLPSGVYIARLTAGDWSATQKLVLLK